MVLSRRADAGADIGDDAVEVADVDIGIGEDQQFRLLGAEIVGCRAAGVGDEIERIEIGLAALFYDEVAAQIVVELVADAAAEERGRAEAAVVVKP